MKIILLAGGLRGTHATRWANGLAEREVEVHFVTMQRRDYKLSSKVKLHLLPVRSPIGYLANIFALKKLLDQIQPDLLNAHYASGYGLLARLCGFRPTLLSVWGSDVYDFPNKSRVHRWLLRKNLQFPEAIASTSHAMARQVRSIYEHPTIHITPFGVDESLFRPLKCAQVGAHVVVIGTVKTLSWKYGIDTLIRAFVLACHAVEDRLDLRLEITGDGPDRKKLERMAIDLGVASKVTFHGAVSHELVSEKLSRLDVYVALSRLDSESFGVAIIEASACGLPVIVSDVDGPAEVMIDQKTAFIVGRNDVKAAAERIIELAEDRSLRSKMGDAGRKHVLENYTWSGSLIKMIEVYKSFSQKSGSNGRSFL